MQIDIPNMISLMDDVAYEFYHEIKRSVILRIFIMVSISIWICWLWSRRRFYWLSMKLPGPIGLPILGNALDMGAFGKGSDVAQNILKLGSKYSSPFCIWGGLECLVVISEPDDFEVLLMNNVSSIKDKRYDMMKPCIGAGLLSNSGPLWKKHRQIINPSFNSATLRSFQSIHNKHAKYMVEGLKKECDKGVIDTIKYCKRCVGDDLAETLFGINMEYYKGDKDHLIDFTTNITEMIQDRMTKFWQEWESVYRLTKEWKIQKEYLNGYRGYFHTILRHKINKYVEDKKTMDENKIDGDDDVSWRIRTSFEVLVDAMIQEKITEQEVLDEFDNLYNPGVETTFSQIGFFMLMMGMHKHNQDKLWKEVEGYYGEDRECEVLGKHLKELPYLDMCIKEIIRLFPTGPIVTRNMTKDFQLKSMDIVIPEGTHILFSVYILHRNPKYWQMPNTFNPDRFTPEQSKNRHSFAFAPFLYGLRNCIGQNLALDLLKTVAVHLMRNYEFHSNMTIDQLKLTADVSTRCSDGYNVAITKRKYN